MRTTSQVRLLGSILSHATVNALMTKRLLSPLFVFSLFLVFLTPFITPSLSYSLTPEYQSLFSLTEKLNSPTAVAIGPQGRIYVANVNNNRIQVFTQQGQRIGTLKNLASPISVEVDANGWIYVGNERKGNVEVYDAQFHLQHKLGRRGTNDHV